MFRIVPHILLLMLLLMLQLFIFDKLLISTMVAPMVYITFIILLPMQFSQLKMLLFGFGVGLLFDLVSGMSGVNSIATIFVSYTRILLLDYTVGKDIVQLGIAPTPMAIGKIRFFRYAAAMLLLHSTILFSVEFLRVDEMLYLLRRILFSSAASLPFVWLISDQFEKMLSRR